MDAHKSKAQQKGRSSADSFTRTLRRGRAATIAAHTSCASAFGEEKTKVVLLKRHQVNTARLQRHQCINEHGCVLFASQGASQGAQSQAQTRSTASRSQAVRVGPSLSGFWVSASAVQARPAACRSSARAIIPRVAGAERTCRWAEPRMCRLF